MPSVSRDLPLQIRNLLAQIHNLLLGRVSVDRGLVFDVAGTSCVFKRVEGFLKRCLGWRTTRYHASAAVATETVLKDAGKFAVTIRNMHRLLCLVSEGRYDVAKSKKRLVDIDTLLEHGAGRTSFLGPFASRQIDKVELRHGLIGRALTVRVIHFVTDRRLLYRHREDTV